MICGVEPKHLKVLNQLVIDPLKKSGSKVWIFGSRARGDHKKFSDIDLLFEGGTPNIGQIQEDIEESDIPYIVDIVDLKNLAESYKENVLNDRLEL